MIYDISFIVDEYIELKTEYVYVRRRKDGGLWSLIDVYKVSKIYQKCLSIHMLC